MMSNDFLGHVGKQLDKEAKLNFKTYDVAKCKKKKNYNKHIARNLEKVRAIRQ